MPCFQGFPLHKTKIIWWHIHQYSKHHRAYRTNENACYAFKKKKGLVLPTSQVFMDRKPNWEVQYLEFLETTKLIFESSCSKPQGKHPSLHPHMKNLKDLPIMAKDTHETRIALKYEDKKKKKLMPVPYVEGGISWWSTLVYQSKWPSRPIQ